MRRSGDGYAGGRASPLLELEDDGPHPGHVLRVLGRLRVEVTELGNPLPLGARCVRLWNPVVRRSQLALGRLGGRAVRRLQLGHLKKNICC